MSRFTICYDIAHTGQRTKVARILLEYGRRLQYSVFEIWLEPEDMPELRRRIGPLLAKSDRFDVIPTDTRRPEQRYSWQRSPGPDNDIHILGPFPSGERRPAKKEPHAGNE